MYSAPVDNIKDFVPLLPQFDFENRDFTNINLQRREDRMLVDMTKLKIQKLCIIKNIISKGDQHHYFFQQSTLFRNQNTLLVRNVSYQFACWKTYAEWYVCVSLICWTLAQKRLQGKKYTSRHALLFFAHMCWGARNSIKNENPNFW